MKGRREAAFQFRAQLCMRGSAFGMRPKKFWWNYFCKRSRLVPARNNRNDASALYVDSLSNGNGESGPRYGAGPAEF